MPAVSKSQQRFFGYLLANPKERKKEGVSKKVAKDFASTKHDGLPEKKMAKEELQSEESIKDKMDKAFKKGAKRHKVAIQKKKEREGKAVNYATMAQSYEPELELVEEPERTPAYKAMQKKLYPRGSTIDAKTGKDNATAGQIGGFRKQINRGRKRKVMAEFEPELELVEASDAQKAAIKDAILQRKEALKKKMKARLNKEDWKPEIEHSKLGDAVKKKREKKRKEAESSLPPHLRLDVMKKAFAHTNEEVVKEEGAPTMSTGSTATAAGFSDGADENGPTAGMSAPLGGLKGQPRGRGPKLKKQKYKCKKDSIGNVICTTEAHLMGDAKKVKIMSGVHDTRYWPHIVEIDGTPGTDFVFYGRSPADVKLRLRKIYRPEQHKNMKVKRITPGEAMKYHWNKKLEAS